MAADLQFNKYAGAILATALGILGLREATNIAFAPEKLEKAGYAIQVPESMLGGTEEAPELPPDWGTLLPAANTATGATTAARCQSCHNFERGGANGTGPGLWGVMGGAIAGHAGFAYSDALKAHGGKVGGIWTYDEMDGFLKNPQRHVPGTKMTFAGLRNIDDRVNLIAYMRSMTDAPPPIPAPDPARQPGAAPAAAGAAGPAAAGRESETVPQGEGQPTSAEGAAGIVAAPAGSSTGSPPTAAGGGGAGQTPAYGQPGGAPQAVQASPGGEGGGRGSGSVSPGGGGTTTKTGTAAAARPATNPAAQNPTPTPRRNPNSGGS
jgi:cytochrome c